MTDPDRKKTASGAPTTASVRPRRRRWLRWAALAASGLVLAVAATGWTLYQRLEGNIRTDSGAAHALAPYEKERPAPAKEAGEAENILLLGSDNRGDGNGAYGRDEGSERSDTAILLHIAADRDSATAMSIPRDLMVDIPGCRQPDGSTSPARFAQFNWAFQTGGAACAIRTVEKMTDIRVDHHLVVDFRGFKKMVDAVGGVEVCLSKPVHDREAKLDLPAGRQTLHGEDALGYVRARHGLGNGSDTQRIERQQRFLGSLVKKVRSDGVLLNPTRAYPVLDAATSSLTADSGLDSLSELYELAQSVRDIPQDHIRFLTVPRQPYEPDINRDELVRPAAEALFTKLRTDQPVSVKEKRKTGKEKNGVEDEGADGTGVPYQGTTADAAICTNE
ncbi:LCP family protein [Streptomyces albus]|uniref:LCP family protein n=1 Tax=Streptomyces TaxID=1883 RepID=UPI0004BFF3CC|nr:MULTISPECIES: LCP family protein [Streptomyces]